MAQEPHYNKGTLFGVADFLKGTLNPPPPPKKKNGGKRAPPELPSNDDDQDEGGRKTQLSWTLAETVLVRVSGIDLAALSRVAIS